MSVRRSLCWVWVYDDSGGLQRVHTSPAQSCDLILTHTRYKHRLVSAGPRGLDEEEAEEEPGLVAALWRTFPLPVDQLGTHYETSSPGLWHGPWTWCVLHRSKTPRPKETQNHHKQHRCVSLRSLQSIYKPESHHKTRRETPCHFILLFSWLWADNQRRLQEVSAASQQIVCELLFSHFSFCTD